MIDFQKLDPSQKENFDRLLQHCGERGCEYSFANLYMWGLQKAAFLGEDLLFFSQFDRKSVYPFPIIRTEPKKVLDAIIDDARQRGIRCRLTTMTAADCALLEQLYPGKFQFHPDRDGYDYVYAIDDLADLKGRKFQKKRNHLNRFRAEHPECKAIPLTQELLQPAREMVLAWLDRRIRQAPEEDMYLECKALRRGFDHYGELGFEGMVLMENGIILAVTMATRLSEDTINIHFEKALEEVDGAYAAINCEFARYLREKHPDIRYLNREDDLGLTGLRKAKLSYCPDHLVEKSWARLLEDDDED